jgi:hypothetical protein
MPFGIIKYWFITGWPFLLYGLLELRSNLSQIQQAFTENP